MKLKFIFFVFIFCLGYTNKQLFALTLTTGSCTTTQQFGQVYPGAINQPILQLKFVVSNGGGGTPVNVCNFSFNASNTLNSEVLVAKLYYTNTSAAFNTSTLIGTVSNPNGTITFNITQPLNSTGNHYIWLAYDLSSTTGLCSKFDASVNNIFYANSGGACPGTPFTPLTPNPDGFCNTAGPDCWTQKANFPGVARNAAMSFTIGSKVYIGGGYDGTNYYSDFFEYDPSINTWTSKAAIPGQARYGASGFNIGTKGYCFAGYWLGTYYGTLVEYDAFTDSWSAKTPLPDTLREYSNVSVIGTKAYIHGGFNNSYTPNTLGDLWEWDQTINVWTEKNRIPASTRYAGTGLTLNGKCYFGLGTNSSSVALNDFWQYNPGTNTWSAQTSFTGTARNTPATMVLGPKAYVALGSSPPVKSDVYEYNPNKNSWKQLSDFPGSARSNVTYTSIESSYKAYVGCGYSTMYLNEFWEYTPPNQIIINSTNTNSFCPGATIIANCTIYGTFLTGNVFSLELSDTLGSFSSPVVIGTSTGTTLTSISGIIPTNATAGSLYRVRITASNWPTTGDDNLFDLTILSNSVAPSTINTSSNLLCASESCSLTVVGGFLGSGASWNWMEGTCVGTIVNTGSSVSFTPVSTKTYYVKAIGTCNTTTCANISITVPTVNGGTGNWIWQGNYSVDWFDPCNWIQKSLPDANSDVNIPGGTTYNPTITGTTANCKTITINTSNGAHVTINTSGGGHLNVQP